MCQPGAAAPPGGRSGLWRVAEHARSGARVDVMMSGPAAERSNGSGPSQSNAAIARRLTQEISTTPTNPEAAPPESPHPRHQIVSDVLTHHILDVELDRFRCGVRPISSRVATDLGAEYDRSRGGSGPISTRSTTDLGEGGGERSAPDACSVGAPHEERARIHTRSQAACGRDQFAVDLDRCRVGEPNDRFGAATQSHASQRAGGVGVGGGEGR